MSRIGNWFGTKNRLLIKWTSTQNNILTKVIESEGLAFCKALYKTRSLINEFANEENINGTYIDKVLYVNKNFSKFCDKKIFQK